MTIKMQVTILIIMIVLFIPVGIRYLFFPVEKIFNNYEIDIDATIMSGILISVCFYSSIGLTISLIIVFPLFGIPLFIACVYSLYKNRKIILDKGFSNYNKHHKHL